MIIGHNSIFPFVTAVNSRGIPDIHIFSTRIWLLSDRMSST